MGRRVCRCSNAATRAVAADGRARIFRKDDRFSGHTVAPTWSQQFQHRVCTAPDRELPSGSESRVKLIRNRASGTPVV